MRYKTSAHVPLGSRRDATVYSVDESTDETMLVEKALFWMMLRYSIQLGGYDSLGGPDINMNFSVCTFVRTGSIGKLKAYHHVRCRCRSAIDLQR